MPPLWTLAEVGLTRLSMRPNGVLCGGAARQSARPMRTDRAPHLERFDRVRQRPGTGKAEDGGERGASKVQQVEWDRLITAPAGPDPQRLLERQQLPSR